MNNRRNIKIHYIQHVPFETPANILKFCQRNKIEFSGTLLYQNEEFPKIKEFDILFIMGGPMSVYDEDKYEWLKEEKKFIEKVIKADKIVVGICLGAQLIADVLGAKVYKNRYREIGWFRIEMNKEALKKDVFKKFPETFIAFHWHGDTFDIPEGAINIGKSFATENQGFIYREKIIGIQFHLEVNIESVKKLVKSSKGDFKKDKYVQSISEILNKRQNFLKLEGLNTLFLSNLINLSSRNKLD